MKIFPGETAQTIHQDDASFRLQRLQPPLVVNTMANGATGLVHSSAQSAELAVPAALARTLPSPLVELLGYDTCEFVGYVDRHHPLQALAASA